MLVIVCDEKRGSASPKRWPFQIKLFQEIGGHAGRLLSAHLRCCLQLASHRAPCCAVRDGMQAGTCHHERPDSCLFFSPGPLERLFLARRNRTHLRQVVVKPASCTAPSEVVKELKKQKAWLFWSQVPTSDSIGASKASSAHTAVQQLVPELLFGRGAIGCVLSPSVA